MADISLTASMRSNLLSLQNTQSLMDMTQERLSTGKKVNSAIDNPSSYYTAQSLNNRASDLDALLDSMGQGIQTIKAANEGIETITSFVEQAKAVANSARDAASIYDQYAITTEEVTEPITGSIFVDTRADLSTFTLEFAASENEKTFTVYMEDGTQETIETIDAGTSTEATVIAADVLTKLQGMGLNAELDEAGTKITVSTTDGTAVSWTNGTDGTGTAANGLKTQTSAALLVDLDPANTGKNSATVAAAINAANDGRDIGIEAKADGKRVAITAPDAEFRIFADNTPANQAALEALGGAKDKKAGDATEIKQERVNYAAQFDEILSQIDNVAKDSGYKGINLLQENDLTVIFNEDRSSKLEVKGVDASSEGLSIAASRNGWQRDTDIEVAISQVEAAINELRTMASEFGNNYSIVQTREDFTDNLINVLTEGADNLTLADMNEESANMLALQTRQQLAINSLSLASQASQAVLQLF